MVLEAFYQSFLHAKKELQQSLDYNMAITIQVKKTIKHTIKLSLTQFYTEENKKCLPPLFFMIYPVKKSCFFSSNQLEIELNSITNNF